MNDKLQWQCSLTLISKNENIAKKHEIISIVICNLIDKEFLTSVQLMMGGVLPDSLLADNEQKMSCFNIDPCVSQDYFFIRCGWGSHVGPGFIKGMPKPATFVAKECPIFTRLISTGP